MKERIWVENKIENEKSSMLILVLALARIRKWKKKKLGHRKGSDLDLRLATMSAEADLAFCLDAPLGLGVGD